MQIWIVNNRRYNDDDTFAKCRACGLIFDIGEVGTHASVCKASKSEKKRVTYWNNVINV